MSDANVQLLVQRWFDDLWTRGDIEVLHELTTDDFVCHASQDFAISRSRDEYAPSVAWYHQCFKEPHWRIDELIVAGDRAVVRCTGTATYQGGWFDIPGTGQPTRECSIIIFRIDNGKIAELWFEISDLDVVHQLGAVVCASDRPVPDIGASA